MFTFPTLSYPSHPISFLVLSIGPAVETETRNPKPDYRFHVPIEMLDRFLLSRILGKGGDMISAPRSRFLGRRWRMIAKEGLECGDLEVEGG